MAVEPAGALGPAFGVKEHRLGAQLECVPPFDTLGRGERPVAWTHFGLGRVEHVVQRRPGGELDAEFAQVPVNRTDAERIRAGVGERVIVAVNVPDAGRVRGGGGRIAVIARTVSRLDDAHGVSVGVGGRFCADGGRTVVSRAPIGGWRIAGRVVRHGWGSSGRNRDGERGQHRLGNGPEERL